MYVRKEQVSWQPVGRSVARLSFAIPDLLE